MCSLTRSVKEYSTTRAHDFLTIFEMRVSKIHSSFLPTVTPADDLVWTKHEDDVMTAVQCSGRLTIKVFSSGKINPAIQSALGRTNNGQQSN